MMILEVTETFYFEDIMTKVTQTLCFEEKMIAPVPNMSKLSQSELTTLQIQEALELYRQCLQEYDGLSMNTLSTPSTPIRFTTARY